MKRRATPDDIADIFATTGMTDTAIAAALGVHQSTITRWRRIGVSYLTAIAITTLLFRTSRWITELEITIFRDK